MPFTGKSGKFNAAIRTVEIGTGDKAVKLGGENVLPFYTFDAPIENAPKIGSSDYRHAVWRMKLQECIGLLCRMLQTFAEIAKESRRQLPGADFVVHPL